MDIEDESVREYDKRSFRVFKENYGKINNYDKKKKSHLKAIALANKKTCQKCTWKTVTICMVYFN